MTLCPITKQEMMNLYLGNDRQSYERAAISQWLEKRRHSPITRAPMDMYHLSPDHSLSRLISNMKQFSISISDIENMESLEPSRLTATKPSPTPEDTMSPSTENVTTVSLNKKGLKRKRKAASLKPNQNSKN